MKDMYSTLDICNCLPQMNSTCDANAICEAATDSCKCKPGFTGNGTVCMDIDECTNPSICPDNSICQNTIGSYKCNCIGGVDEDGQTCAKVFNVTVPNISNTDVAAVMNWIKVEVAQTKLPFCWKQTYGRGVGSTPTECPPGKELIGALCYSKCPGGSSRYGFDCHSNCPSGFDDQGLFCRQSEYGRGGGYPWQFGDGFDNNGMIHRCENDNGGGNCEMSGAIAYPKCKPGYSAFGCCICRPDVPNCPSLGLNTGIDLSCAKKVIIGDPTPKICSSGLETDAGLCYPTCKSGFYGIGPVCWSSCDSNQFDCTAACTTDQATCALGVVDQVVGPLVVAANIASLGMSAPSLKAITIPIKTAGGVIKQLSGTTKLGKALVNVVTTLRAIGNSPIGKKTMVLVRKVDAHSGEIIDAVLTAKDVGVQLYELSQQYRDEYANDFSGQTSPEINNAIDAHYNPTTAQYLKQMWADIQLVELAEVNNWEVAGNLLDTVSMVDETGITGLVAAYAKPICQTVVPFPCIQADLKYSGGMCF
jgi:Calcium-binding EGF domain